jgi:hypothetical protein
VRACVAGVGGVSSSVTSSIAAQALNAAFDLTRKPSPSISGRPKDLDTGGAGGAGAQGAGGAAGAQGAGTGAGGGGAQGGAGGAQGLGGGSGAPAMGGKQQSSLDYDSDSEEMKRAAAAAAESKEENVCTPQMRQALTPDRPYVDGNLTRWVFTEVRSRPPPAARCPACPLRPPARLFVCVVTVVLLLRRGCCGAASHVAGPSFGSRAVCAAQPAVGAACGDAGPSPVR